LIAIIDYGMGNLRSVTKGFETMGVEVRVTDSPAVVDDAGGVVLPGVGAFSDAMDNLNKLGLAKAVRLAVKKGKPFLGICLGLQLLFESSEEWGFSAGLAIFPGRVLKLPAGLKVPHMGWNTLTVRDQSCPLCSDIPENAAFYFVHSYYVAPTEPSLSVCTTNYGIEFTSVAAREHVIGIQFHPEKSSILGLRILQKFGGLVEKC